MSEPVGNGVGLSDLLNLALTQSPKLSVQRAQVGQAQMSALATGLFPNPVVEGGGKDVSGGDSGLVLGLNQELPMNGSRKLERQAAALRHSAERATLERDVQVVFSEIESAYVDILTAQRLVEVDRRGLEIASDSLRLVSDNYRAGLASSLPLSLAVSERANALKTLKLSEKQVQVARSTLAGLLALDEASLAPISGSLDEPLLPLGLQGGNLDRPDLRAADLKVQAAQSDTHADRRRRIPNPTLGYQREEADDTENFFTIGMEIPIFNSGRLKIQESMASQQVVSKERSALAQTIQTEVQTGATRLDSAREAVSIYETEIRPSISQSLESAKSAFQSGTTDMSLLLQTQSKLIENERDYIRALQELRDAEIAYKLAIGVRKETVQ
ncbi:MAG: TolC family protein [Candidatus Omnitrophica bacterium]|nr:TolC family protein [Candidatus Omnitrophota bacterium]